MRSFCPLVCFSCELSMFHLFFSNDFDTDGKSSLGILNVDDMGKIYFYFYN